MGGEIVVADPFQRYLGLEIASDAPRPSERDDVPYHLVGDLALSDNSNPGDYAHRAHSVIDDVLGRDRVPIVAGGTGLYLRGAVADLDMRPSPDPGVRAWAETLSVDTASALAELRRRDPRAAERIDGANPRRLARALERSVAGEEALGNDLWSAPDRLPTLLVGVDRPRAVLHALIAIRVRRELDEGLVDELTRALARPDLARGPAQVIGMREVAAVAAGDLPRDSLEQVLCARTRRLARMQATWMRRLAPAEVLDLGDDPAVDALPALVAMWRHARGDVG